MTFVAALEPTPLWQHFDDILTVPRASKDEERIRAHILAVAKNLNLKYQTDAAGNVVISKPGSTGHEQAPTTILQSHLDMVQEKNTDVNFDFSTDAIVPARDGEYITATGTTLGSDNGIGVAAMLAVMSEPNLIHGPLEFLFTIDEETGLTGAAQIDGSLLVGRQLINLDSEEENILYVGCAGGGDTHLTLNMTDAPISETEEALTLNLTGLKGGHSGCDIHLQRGNALCLLGRILLSGQDISFRIASLNGGSAHNAIPREAFATVVVESEERQAFETLINNEFSVIQTQYQSVDPNMSLTVTDSDPVASAWDHPSTMTGLQLLSTLPHGVDAMSYDIPDLVETSNNVATAKSDAETLVITTSTRSSVDASLDALRRRIHAGGQLAGAQIEEFAAYPGWKPNLQSHLLEVVKSAHLKELGTEPDVKAIHAGLECGIIGKKVAGMDMISFGPIIEFPHSPDERVHISSVERFYRLLTATLASLA